MSKLPICAALLVFAGCAVDDETAYGTADQAVASENRLSGNRLSGNGLRLGALTRGRLSRSSNKNQYFVDDTNPLLVDMLRGETSRDVLRYAVGCALASDEELIGIVDGTRYTLVGRLNLVHDWVTKPLGTKDQELLTACLLAHTNYFGVTVPISVRGPHLSVQQAERLDYTVEEAAFYGNLFANPPVLRTCAGAGILARDPSPYLAQRVCATTTNGVTTPCGFVTDGFCAVACDDDNKKCGPDATYEQVVTVYLP
jgi:hypothetical protein